MLNLKEILPLKRIILFVFSTFFIGCVDPIKPEINFIEGLVFIDAIISTEQEASFVTIKESAEEFGANKNIFVEGASVLFINSTNYAEIILTQENEIYLPPVDFTVKAGEVWELLITLPDGRKYKSLPEIVLNPIEITSIKTTYNPELIYRDESGEYIPGHDISVNFDDPPNDENYYLWSFRSFEKIKLCKTCRDGIFRNGICVDDPPGLNGIRSHYDYFCSSNCWLIRHSEEIRIFSDEFSNGLSLSNISVANILLYTKENILVEIQQFSISLSAYKYYKVLKDIVADNGSLNAPPPAAFVGNIYNIDDDEEYVLGRFTTASTTTRSIFINRESITERPIEVAIRLDLEVCEEVCSLIECTTEACSEVTIAPCVESRYRTGIEPEGWIE